MRTIRVFSDQRLQEGGTVTLGEREYHHSIKVLRLRTGDAITLFNGDGFDYLAVLTVLKREASALIQSKREGVKESPLKVTLVQGISRGERMDFVLQKSVELGVDRIQPVLTARTVVKLDSKRRENRMNHWRSIMISACEQSGRSVVPELAAPVNLSEYLQQINGSDTVKLVLSPTGEQSISQCAELAGLQVDVLIGPEGGLSDTEIEVAQKSGFIPVRMGPRVLRTETAALVALSVLQDRFGDLSD